MSDGSKAASGDGGVKRAREQEHETEGDTVDNVERTVRASVSRPAKFARRSTPPPSSTRIRELHDANAPFRLESRVTTRELVDAIVSLIQDNENGQHNDDDGDEFDLEKATAVLPRSPIHAEKRLLHGRYADSLLVEEVWKQKARMDSVFDQKNDRFYYQARDATFPADRSGSRRFRNRAGDKLWEVHESTGAFRHASRHKAQHSAYIDIAGGPGAWSEVLMQERSHWRGFGISLRSGLKWYKSLTNARQKLAWTCLWGADGTGNLYVPENVTHAAKAIKERDDVSIVLAVGDGGFAIPSNDKGDHMEHLQEVYSARLVLSEFVMALRVLVRGGNWVCKMFDTLSDFSASIVYLTTLFFESSYVVKPRRSRIVNSERYLVGKRLRFSRVDPDDSSSSSDEEKAFRHMCSFLDRIHETWDDESAPEALVPLGLMHGDELFQESMRDMVTTLVDKQIKALRHVMDQVDVAIKREAERAKRR